MELLPELSSERLHLQIWRWHLQREDVLVSFLLVLSKLEFEEFERRDLELVDLLLDLLLLLLSLLLLLRRGLSLSGGKASLCLDIGMAFGDKLVLVNPIPLDVLLLCELYTLFLSRCEL